jgi:hypothetical protein
MIIAFDPGFKRVAFASLVEGQLKVGYVHRGKMDSNEYLKILMELCEGMSVGIVESQYIKKMKSPRLQTAVAASILKVKAAAQEIATILTLCDAEVVSVHPKTWQTMIGSPVGTKAVKAAAKEFAEKLIKPPLGQDLCDAVCMLYWYKETL